MNNELDGRVRKILADVQVMCMSQIENIDTSDVPSQMAADVLEAVINSAIDGEGKMKNVRTAG